MKSDEKLWGICMVIYRIMYKEASPSADFDAMIESGEALRTDRRDYNSFFEKYFLDDERQMEIINETCKENKLTKREKDKVKTTVLLGCSPTINIENQKRALEQELT